MGAVVIAFHMTPAQLQLRDPESDISLTSALWGFTGAAVIGFPLSILGWQLHTDTWCTPPPPVVRLNGAP